MILFWNAIYILGYAELQYWVQTLDWLFGIDILHLNLQGLAEYLLYFISLCELLWPELEDIKSYWFLISQI